ncbi:hypothetical protein [Nonomuraea sp. NPDC049709]|uniref:hypothetical protein n=1 Tax=Nonomuraea sp. NPDC049709 TaxID=3154736 RepID=UPI003420A8BD
MAGTVCPIDQRLNLTTATNRDSRWLFPGRRGGQPMTTDAVEKRLPLLGRPEAVQLAQERQTALELVERRGLRHVLQPVELAAPGDRVDQQQPGQPRPRSDANRPDTSTKNPRFTSVRIFLVISSSVV